MRSSVVLVGFLMLPLVVGCGSGTDQPAVDPTPISTPVPSPSPSPIPVPTVKPRVILNWGARSRGIGGLTSARSVLLRFPRAAVDGGDLTVTVNRSELLASYIETVTLNQEAVQGQRELRAEFFADPNGGGTLVGVAQGVRSLGPDGYFGDIALEGRVASVTLFAGQEFIIGKPTEPRVAIADAAGRLLALSPGSLFLTLRSGQNFARLNAGNVEGDLPGTIRLSAVVDKVESVVVASLVRSEAIVTITPPSSIVPIGNSINLQATVLQTNGGSTAVTWIIREGSVAGAISSTGTFTASGTPGIYHIVATSQYDPSRSSETTISVVAGGLTFPINYPTTGSVNAKVK